MNINSLHNGIKKLRKIYQKIDNIEIQKKLLDLSKQALEMQNEILKLQEENIKIKQKEDVSSKIKRHKDAYITLKEDNEGIIYCANCWDSKGLLVEGQPTNDGSYYCSNCKEKKYYDMELYDRTYTDYNYDNSNIF